MQINAQHDLVLDLLDFTLLFVIPHFRPSLLIPINLRPVFPVYSEMQINAQHDLVLDPLDFTSS